LIEAPAEKKKLDARNARWEDAVRVGARGDRIKIKMLRSNSAREGSIKRVVLGEREGKRGVYSC
jgi:hypothetical protein